MMTTLMFCNFLVFKNCFEYDSFKWCYSSQWTRPHAHTHTHTHFYCNLGYFWWNYRISCFCENCFQIAPSHITNCPPLRGGSTQTGLALKYVLRKGFQGGRNATAAARIVILLSDGRSQGNVAQAAAELKETGAVVFAVGLRYPMYDYLFLLEKDLWRESIRSL